MSNKNCYKVMVSQSKKLINYYNQYIIIIANKYLCVTKYQGYLSIKN